MACLKCGKETEEDRSFCADCRAVMDLYPVKPGTPVVLLQRPEREPEKEQDRAKRPLADRYRRLQRLCYFAVGLCFLMLSGIAAMAYLLLR